MNGFLLLANHSFVVRNTLPELNSGSVFFYALDR
ncbi:hypothetical protein ACVLD2_000179 [Paenibacillus sp. PvR052]|nr:hypothetical protein [Paenibacillus sp. PvP091]MBP1168715.1 hypothetical protein [Paenibacillus sp. PvR098]MBP2439743.1 hypothetical protein [Paenibacillus sp. PvP052]